MFLEKRRELLSAVFIKCKFIHSKDDLTFQDEKSFQNIVDQPIVLTIYSNNCPDLTMIDLPGITKVSIAG